MSQNNLKRDAATRAIERSHQTRAHDSTEIRPTYTTQHHAKARVIQKAFRDHKAKRLAERRAEVRPGPPQPLPSPTATPAAARALHHHHHHRHHAPAVPGDGGVFGPSGSGSAAVATWNDPRNGRPPPPLPQFSRARCCTGLCTCYNVVCSSQELYPPANDGNDMPWYLPLGTVATEECCCVGYACLFWPCVAFDVRSRVLKGHFELYKCCQGTVTSRLDRCTSKCPKFCLGLEVLFCTVCAVEATRALLAKQNRLGPDPCENRISRVGNCAGSSGLWWLCCGAIDESEWVHTVEKLDDRHNVTCCGRILTCFCVPCLQVQTLFQLWHPSDRVGDPPAVVPIVVEQPAPAVTNVWSSPLVRNHRRPEGFLDPPKEKKTKAGKSSKWRGGNKVHPMSPRHPLSPHLRGVGDGGVQLQEVESPDEAMEAAAIRAAWATSVQQQPPAGWHSPVDDARVMSWRTYDGAGNSYHGSPGSALGGGTRTQQWGARTRGGGLIQPLPRIAMDTTIDSAPEAPQTPKTAKEEYQSTSADYSRVSRRDSATAHGEALLAGRAQANYASTNASLGHLQGAQLSPGRLSEAKARRAEEEAAAEAMSALRENRAASVIQGRYRKHRRRQSEDKAARVIQGGFRQFQRRRSEVGVAAAVGRNGAARRQYGAASDVSALESTTGLSESEVEAQYQEQPRAAARLSPVRSRQPPPPPERRRKVRSEGLSRDRAVQALLNSTGGYVPKVRNLSVRRAAPSEENDRRKLARSEYETYTPGQKL